MIDYPDFEGHPFNQTISALVEKFAIKESTLRMVKITSPKTHQEFSYIEIKSAPGRKLDSITNLLINLIKIAIDYKHIFTVMDNYPNKHYIEIDANNKHVGPTLEKLADQMIAREGYEHFRRAFKQLPNLPADNEFLANTGRSIKLNAYIVPSNKQSDGLIYGFKLVTTDERIVEQAMKLGKMSVINSPHNKRQFEIISNNGNNEQMSQLLVALPFICDGKPQARTVGGR